MTRFITDAEVAARLDAPTAVATMRAALLAADQGRLVAPPRTSAPLHGGRLVLTVGHLRGEWYGYRSYDTLDQPDGEQVVVLHDAARAGSGPSPSARRSARGGPGRSAGWRSRPSPARTPPPSGSSVPAARPGPSSGRSRRYGPLREVRVFSRTPARREQFVARVRSELGITARSVADLGLGGTRPGRRGGGHDQRRARCSPPPT